MSETYVGSELDLFQAAVNWKRYFAKSLVPFVGGRVLDVGAGIGSNIAPLMNRRVVAWTALEPDATLAARIKGPETGALQFSVRVGTLAQVADEEMFDSILYIDVLEHIADDRDEVLRAAAHLAPGGNLIVLVPAFQMLFSPFDAAIGHHRRYVKKMLRQLTPPDCDVSVCRMLDSVGFFASCANRMLLRSASPTKGQIRTWDSLMVPLSRWVDPLLGHSFGRSCVIVWSRKVAGEHPI